MKKKLSEFASHYSSVFLYTSAILAACLGYAALRLWILQNENTALQNQIGIEETTIQVFSSSLADFKDKNSTLSSTLADTEKKKQSYAKKVDNLSDKVDTLNDTVDVLERTVKIDPQLLLKYSKVFFLSENYVPSGLTTIPTDYTLSKTNPIEIHDKVWPFLKKMLDAAHEQKLLTVVNSGYRSFKVQAQIKDRYAVIYGAGTANSFSAEQGYSEHQLGTTVDLTVPSIGSDLTGFETSQSYTWLLENAYKYGFVISYPQGNGYYIFEPWHWRFVGLDLALKLHDEKKNFYDLDQREISTYLINIFNTKTSPVPEVLQQ